MYWTFFSISFGFIAYFLLCLLNPSGGPVAIFLIALVYFGILKFLSVKTKLPEYMGGDVYKNVVLTCLSILIPVILLDLFLVGRALVNKTAHDIPVVPGVLQVTNSDGFHSFIQEPNYSAESFVPGQAASKGDWGQTEAIKPRFQKIETDSNGLRNHAGAKDKPVQLLLMGDSFAFGYGTSQDDIWSELLAKATRTNVYNMGVYGEGPGAQVELLKYLIESSSIKMSRGADVFFLIFQGNDLTDRTPYNHENRRTTLDRLVGYMKYVQRHTIIYNLWHIHEVLEQKKTGYELAKSSKLPDAIFLYKPFARSEEETKRIFVEKSLSTALKRLKQITDAFEANVTILYCPTKAHAYYDYYDLPKRIGDKGHDFFRDLLKDKCRNSGFAFFDLLPVIDHWAQRGEMLYWTDDTHLSSKGHAVLAETVLRLRDENDSVR